MSLNVDWSRVQPPLTDAEKEYGAYNVGIVMMALGINQVGETIADLHEILARARFYEKVHGPLFRYADSAKPSPAGTADYWKRWVGVRINAVKESRRAWSKRTVDSAWSDIVYQLGKEL